MTDSKQSKQPNTGQYGEQLAADYLRKQGYRIIATNWRASGGELDIIAQPHAEPDDLMLVFVEVRTRHATNTESAFASLTARNERERLIATLHAYLDAHNYPPDTAWRLDVIAIALRPHQPPLIDHLEDAFDW